MFFNKFLYAANFRFADRFSASERQLSVGERGFAVQMESFANDVHHVQITHPELWTENLGILPLIRPASGPSNSQLTLDESGQLQLVDPKGKVILRSQPGMGFGVMGRAHLFCFELGSDMQFLGLGEKTFHTLEVSDRRTKYWNTDALGDFNMAIWPEQPLDPYYASIPYLIIKQGNTYAGLLLDNPATTFIDTGTDPSFFQTEKDKRKIIVGSEDGMPSLWVLYGPSLDELTCKLQHLVGLTPRPPLWALGYHQCRWGYKGEADLMEIHGKMVEHEIPNDGVWLDIDYMNGYRVFTISDEHFPNGVPPVTERLGKEGKKVVPIIDPGVKMDPDYAVYQDGKKADIFCKNPEGLDYVGFVWPGETVFPDFTRPDARQWWAKYAADFKKLGFGGAWLDMNDPSTGAVDPHGMLWSQGTLPHAALRNQYALGMQMATREGFQQASPNERIFLVSRSGSTGTSRFSAIWTGDNLSNRFYLKGSIPGVLNLGLSGIPFSGPDVGGFMWDTNEELMVDWMKAGFLFPFFRIHSVAFNRPQEPWQFGKKALKTLRHYIRLRYKLLPYLYQLFIEQGTSGRPLLRPLNYHYPSKKLYDDQFLVGADILQAPFLAETATRKVHLPGKASWFDAETGVWVKPGNIEKTNNRETSPLFFKHGAIIPAQIGTATGPEKDLTEVEFHVFVQSGKSETVYTFDDGATLDFEKGKQSKAALQVEVRRSAVHISTQLIENGYGGCHGRILLYADAKAVFLNGEKLSPRRETVQWTGKKINVLAVDFSL